uniref:Uncharacterized protein n=1 Tax=Strigamia maritima TaxID=126957 RepID=T1J060_STRMM
MNLQPRPQTNKKMANTTLPEYVKIFDFASARIKEMCTLAATIDKKHGPTRIYQTLPRNLRRRAMSYNVKRMPRELREQHKKQLLKQGRKPQTKRPSRKFRRRPKRLLDDYTRRKTQGENTWLETHIWHAKRFKISNLWGYRIPTECCCKMKRQIYRKVVKGALVEDISYYNCIELKGKQKFLIDQLSKLTCNECGETFKSQNAIAGEREGNTFLYGANRYPYDAIGPVKFLWKPMAENELNDDCQRVIWIWVHPATHNTIIEQFIDVFGLIKRELDRKRKILDNEFVGNRKKKLKGEASIGVMDVSDTRVSHLMRPVERVQIYDGSGVVLTDLKDTLVRFRLYGPQSTRVLGCVLRMVKLNDDLNELKRKMWNDICDNGLLTELTPRCVLGLEVRDPRLFMPVKKQQPKPNATSGPSMIDLSNDLSRSLLWDEEIREKVTFTQLSDEDINNLRSKRAVPGLELDLGENEPKIPIILIQNPGNRTSGLSPMNFGAGWDLILPSGWGMPFWISLIYNTALPIGLDTSRFINTSRNLPFFPYDFPDTAAGDAIMKFEENEMTERDLKRPTAKRVNYQALKIASPYTFPWKKLINNYSESNDVTENPTDDFFVLRNRQILKKFNFLIEKQQNSSLTELKLTARCLIFVQLKFVSSGIVDRLAMICLPNESDLAAIRRKSYSNITEIPNSKVKNKSEEPIKTTFAKCRKKRKAIRRKMKNLSDEEEIAQMEEKIAEIQPKLQLPDYSQNINISGSCSRQVIGFVTSCQFLLSVGQVSAFGYCVDAGLKQLMSNGEGIVLLRKKTSLNYACAKINIVKAFDWKLLITCGASVNTGVWVHSPKQHNKFA